jgi:hypothetical protein
MNVTIGLAIALGLSILSNLWLFNSRDTALAEVATQKAANTQLEAVGNACSTSVDALAKDHSRRGERIERLLVGESARILTLQHEAMQAARDRPQFPDDICRSIEAAMRAEILKERAPAKTPAPATKGKP